MIPTATGTHSRMLVPRQSSRTIRPQLSAYRSVSQASIPASRDQPPWLQAVLDDKTPAPRLYAWSVNNLSGTDATNTAVLQALLRRNPQQRIFVLGIGNLGRLFAACLAQSPDPPPVTLVVHRRSLLERWAADPGIEITRHGKTERVDNLDMEWWTEEKPTMGLVKEVTDGDGNEEAVPNLILATKASDAMPQVDRLRRYLDNTSTVLFVQNGMNKLWPPYGGVYDSHRYSDGKHPQWLHGVTMHGVYSTGPMKSVHAAPADVVIGPVLLSEKGQETADYLIRSIVKAPHLSGRAVPRSQVWILQLEKLVVNLVINPLTAVLRCHNGDLFLEPEGDIGKIMDVMLEEVGNVFQALIQHESSQDVLKDAELCREALVEHFSKARLRTMLYAVGEKVKHNKSSMLQDVQNGKQTEIRDFAGWLIDMAHYLDPEINVRTFKTLMGLVEDRAKLDKSEIGRHLLPCT